MATVQIPDDIFEALQAHAKARRLADDPVPLLVEVVRRYSADVCAPGFDRDGLAGSLTRQRLRERVNKATFGSSWTDRTRYHERFLCIDLDNFKKYLDVHGMPASDAVHLREHLCDRLRDHLRIILARASAPFAEYRRDALGSIPPHLGRWCILFQDLAELLTCVPGTDDSACGASGSSSGSASGSSSGGASTRSSMADGGLLLPVDVEGSA